MTQAHVRDMFKKASEIVYRSNIVVSNEPLSPTLSAFPPLKTPRNQEEGHDPEPAEEADIQIRCTAQVEEQKQKFTS